MGSRNGLDYEVGSLTRRGAALGALGATLLFVSLAGCEQLSDPSLAAIQGSGDEFAFVLCQTMTVRELVLEVRENDVREDRWSARGDVRIEAGQVLNESVVRDLFSDADLKSVDLTSSSQVTLLVRAELKSDNVVVAFDAENLVEGEWLRPDDRSYKTACA